MFLQTVGGFAWTVVMVGDVMVVKIVKVVKL